MVSVPRSKMPNRVYIPSPTSPDLGPGTYKGADPISFTTNFPDKESPYFLNDRHIDNTIFGDHFKTLYPRHFRSFDFRQHSANVSKATELKSMAFTERLPNERKFKEANSFTDPVRRATQGYVTRKRIEKMYPRLYNPPKTKT